MKLRSVVSLAALLLGTVTVLAGCGADRNHMLSPTAPNIPTPPDSQWVEVCDTIPGPLIRYDEQSLSTDHPRMVLAKNIIVSCDQHFIRDTTRIDNYEATNVAVVKFLETPPGTSPYQRYYFRDALGDTLLVPDAATTVIPTTVNDVPVGSYQVVALYRPNADDKNIGASASPTDVLCHLTLSGVLRVFCIDCKMVKMPVNP